MRINGTVEMEETKKTEHEWEKKRERRREKEEENSRERGVVGNWEENEK